MMSKEDSRRTRGRAGEEIARGYLSDHDYSILASNFRTRYGEIDIIVQRGGIVAFVEVKARRDKQFGEPFEAVSPRKQGRIRRMAEMWLAANEGEAALADCDFRFDVVSIMLDENDRAAQLLHIEDAFR
ncbi:MAG: YraN family protein [Thermoleophilia bacterium]